MRSVSSAICTSGEPVSPSCWANWAMISWRFSFVSIRPLLYARARARAFFPFSFLLSNVHRSAGMAEAANLLLAGDGRGKGCLSEEIGAERRNRRVEQRIGEPERTW